MKKLYYLLPLLAALLVPGKAAAQMMPDSTVQIVAYWEVGDSVDYTITEEKFSIGQNEEETLVSSFSSLLHIEVVDATDSTYTLSVTNDNLLGSVLGLVLSPEDRAALPRLNYRVKTNELGVFLRMEDEDEFYGRLQQIIPSLTKGYYRSLAKDSKAIFPTEKSFADFMKGKLEDPTYLIKLCARDISDLLFFHGSRLTLGDTYSYDDQYATIIGTVPMTVCFWADQELTDEYSAVLYKSADGNEGMRKLLQDFVYKLQVEEPDALSYEDFCEQFEKDVNLEARLEETLSEEVHLDTGWPIALYYDIESVAADVEDGTVKGNHTSRKIKLVTEEEEGGDE